MKRVLAVLAVLGVLVVPVVGSSSDSASGEDRIPPEANWTPFPPTPPLLAVTQPRTASTSPDQLGVRAPVATYGRGWDEDRIPPEARWSPVPSSPPMVAVEQPRTVSTSPEKVGVRAPAASPSERSGYLGRWEKPTYGGDE